MRKTFKLDEVGCANCASKMQEHISQLDGVHEASVNFLTQKFVLDADDASFEKTVDEAQKIMHKYEPDCDIVR